MVVVEEVVCVFEVWVWMEVCMIVEKYVVLLYMIDFVLLFLLIEGFYVEILCCLGLIDLL